MNEKISAYKVDTKTSDNKNLMRKSKDTEYTWMREGPERDLVC